MIAFFRLFLFPHARKTYALLLSVLVSTHYISYAAILRNIAPYGLSERVRYLIGAVFATKTITLVVLACITYFGVSLALDLLRDLRGEERRLQHA